MKPVLVTDRQTAWAVYRYYRDSACLLYTSTEKFVAAIKKVVKANERFIPPYESGAALYIRPLLIGTGAQVLSLIHI